MKYILLITLIFTHVHASGFSWYEYKKNHIERDVSTTQDYIEKKHGLRVERKNIKNMKDRLSDKSFTAGFSVKRSFEYSDNDGLVKENEILGFIIRQHLDLTAIGSNSDKIHASMKLFGDRVSMSFEYRMLKAAGAFVDLGAGMSIDFLNADTAMQIYGTALVGYNFDNWGLTLEYNKLSNYHDEGYINYDRNKDYSFLHIYRRF
jgi:hypothetical protein